MRYILSYLLFVFSLSYIYSQTNNNLHFDHISIEEGISNSWILDIHQDSLGFIWFGTSDGLNRYDGHSFKVFRNQNTKSTKVTQNNYITICQDDKNHLWLGTSTGISMFSLDDYSFYTDSSWSKEIINALYYYENKIIVSSSRGLYYINLATNSSHRFSIKGSEVLDNLAINKVVVDKSDNLIIGTTNGLYVIDLAHEIFYKIIDENKLNPLTNTNISALMVDDNNGLWIGTYRNGLYYIKNLRVDNPLKNIINYSHNTNPSFSEGIIREIIEDNNDIWVSIENNGIAIIKKNDTLNTTVQQVKNNPKREESLSSNSVYTLLKDRNGNIWVGTYDEGINRLKKTENYFKKINYNPYENNGLINKNINTIQKINHEIWLGTENGISIYNPVNDNFKNLQIKANSTMPIVSNSIWSFLPLSNEKLLIGTWGGGIYEYNHKTNTFSPFKDVELPSPNVFNIIKDSENNIWICNMGGGLVMFNSEKGITKVYTSSTSDPNSISSNWIVSVYESLKHEIWVATPTSIELFNKKKESFSHFIPDNKNPKSIKSSGGIMIFEDSKENLWFASNDGLACFIRSDSSFINYQMDDGLPSNFIKAVLEDDHGNFWISTLYGLSMMKDAINLPKKPVFKNYNIQDGLQGVEFINHSAYKDENGYMYFGGNKGFNMFHPDSIHENLFIPNVVFTNLLVSNQSIKVNDKKKPIKKDISVADEIVLHSTETVFTIEFAALNFVKSSKNQYAYKLEGFEDDWVYCGNKHYANYTNLHPGTYTFKVKASNNDGYWNEKGTQIKIVILPPWYKSKWAIVTYYLLLVLVIYFIIKLLNYRAKLKSDVLMAQKEKQRLDELNTMKTRFYSNVSHEFRTPLSLIISPVEKLIKKYFQDNETTKDLNLIRNNASRLFRLVNQFIDISKVEAGYLKMMVQKGDLARFINIISDNFLYEAEGKQIKYSFKINHGSFETWFDVDKIEKILYNLLSNALKYTPDGGTVTFKVKINNDVEGIEHSGWVEFWVKDTGIGIANSVQDEIFNWFNNTNPKNSESYKSTGVGLSLVKGLVEKYGGVIELTSAPSKGSTFYIRLPHAKTLFNPDHILKDIEPININKIANTLTNNSIIIENENNLSDSNIAKPLLLIVEDNTELINFIADSFKNKYTLLLAKNGKEGLKLCKKNNPDIIVSDIMMPEINGIELCQLIKNDEQTSHIPIILLTAKAEDENYIEGLEIGADDYITKPFNILMLEARINNILEIRRNLRQLFSQQLKIEPTNIIVNSVDSTFLNKALKIIEDNISNSEFNVEKFSEIIGINRTSLHKKLITLTDFAPNVLIRTLRIKRAAQLFEGGIDNVSEVMYSIGIESRSYFIKCFKETYKMVPSEYILQCKKNTKKDC